MPAPTPISIFISKESVSTFWFIIGALGAIGSGIYVERVAATAGLRPQFIMMQSPSVDRVPKDMIRNPDTLRATHLAMTRLAMDSVFNKSPNGLDAPERCQRLFSKEAWHWVNENLVEKQSDAFAEGRIHQKIAINSINLTPDEHDGETSRAIVVGQLIRTGVLRDEIFNEVWNVTVTLVWERNTCLRDAGRFPVLCTSFGCKEIPVASTLRRLTAQEESSLKAATSNAAEAPSTNP